MKKINLAVASVAMAVVLTGCGRSPSSVAEKFANAVIQRDTKAAVSYCYTSAMTEKELKALKEDQIEAMARNINDDKLKATTYWERVLVASESAGYKIVNGEKITEDSADVTIQFVKEKTRKAEGMNVNLVKVDGTWLVFKFKQESGLDTSDK